MAEGALDLPLVDGRELPAAGGRIELPAHPTGSDRAEDAVELVEAEWGVTDNNRKARWYRLTSAGRQRLRRETSKPIIASLDSVAASGGRAEGGTASR